MAEKTRARPTVMPKRDFLVMLQSSFNQVYGDRNITISRERAEQVFVSFMSKVIEKAKQAPFSVRGIGRYYVVSGKTGNRYMRFKTKLDR